MEAIQSLAWLLPTSPGLLPYWLLLTSILSIFNTIACYTSPSLFLRIYSNPFPNFRPSKPTTGSSKKASPISSPSPELASRLFGVWTFVVSILRAYGAYALFQSDIYAITFSTYIIALVHFTSEWLVYGTISFKKGPPPPFFFATTTVIWMIVQWGKY